MDFFRLYNRGLGGRAVGERVFSPKIEPLEVGGVDLEIARGEANSEPVCFINGGGFVVSIIC